MCGGVAKKRTTLQRNLLLLRASARQLGARDVIRVFCEFDASGDGALDLAEFKAALGVMDIRMPLKKVRKLFKLFDQDGNNSVDYMEVRRDPSQTSARPAPL